MHMLRSKRAWTIALGAIAGLVVAACALAQGARVAYESPKFTLDPDSDKGLEIRHYTPRVVAETVVEASSRRAATREGFSRLAGYIFGGNTARDGQASERIAMTSPVEIEPQKIAMTSPVEAAPAGSGEGAWRVVFTMPSEWSLDTLPVPDDARVKLRQEPGRTVAALRFSGTLEPDVVDPQRERLRALVASRGYRIVGPVTVAGYDPPSVVPALRRNEVMAPVERVAR